MIDVIFAIKFAHLLAAAVSLGTWSCVAMFMLLAHRSGNTAVVALISRFVVTAELVLVAPALVLQPLSGFPLAVAIGLSPFGEFWIDVSLVLFAGIVVCWLAVLRIEMRIRGLTREATLNSQPLSAGYRRLFRLWCVLAVPLLLGLAAVYALMVWQPRLD